MDGISFLDAFNSGTFKPTESVDNAELELELELDDNKQQDLELDLDLDLELDLELESTSSVSPSVELDLDLDLDSDTTVDEEESFKLIDPIPFTGFEVKIGNTEDINPIDSYKEEMSVLEKDLLNWLYVNDFDIIDNGDVILDTWNYNFFTNTLSNRDQVLKMYLGNVYSIYVQEPTIFSVLQKLPSTILKTIGIPYREYTMQDLTIFQKYKMEESFDLDTYKKFSLTPDISEQVCQAMTSEIFDKVQALEYSNNIEVFKGYLVLVSTGKFDKDSFDTLVSGGHSVEEYVNARVEGLTSYDFLMNRDDYTTIQRILNEHQDIVSLANRYKDYEGLEYILRASINGDINERFVNKYFAKLDTNISSFIGSWYSDKCKMSASDVEALDSDFYKCYCYQYMVYTIGAKSDKVLNLFTDKDFNEIIYILMDSYFNNVILSIELNQYLAVLTFDDASIDIPSLSRVIKRGVIRFNRAIWEVTLGIEDLPDTIGRELTVMLGNGFYKFYTTLDAIYNTENFNKLKDKFEKYEIADNDDGIILYVPEGGNKYKSRVAMKASSSDSLRMWSNEYEVEKDYSGLLLNHYQFITRYNLIKLIAVLKKENRKINIKILDLLTVPYEEYSKYDKVLGELAMDSKEMRNMVIVEECLILLKVYRMVRLSSTTPVKYFSFIEHTLGKIFPTKFSIQRDGLTSVPEVNDKVYFSGSSITGACTFEEFIGNFSSFLNDCKLAGAISIRIMSNRIYAHFV